MKRYLIFIVIYISAQTAAALVMTCNSGNPNQPELVNQLIQARTSHGNIAQLISKKYSLKFTEMITQASTRCLDCVADDSAFENVKNSGNNLKELVSTVYHKPAKEVNKLVIKPECIAAANLNKAYTPQVTCTKDKKSGKLVAHKRPLPKRKPVSKLKKGEKQPKDPLATDLCVTDSLLDYQNAVISNMYSCIKALGFEGVDIASIYRKFSVEGCFQPNYDSAGGLGPAQLTTTFIDDVLLANRGRGYLEKIAKSSLPDCAAAKVIATKDLTVNEPSRENLCEFITPGEGLERSYLYSMIGIETVWQRTLLPEMKDFLLAHKDHPKIKEAQKIIQMTAYGRGGGAEGKVAIRILKKSKTIDAFIATMNGPLKTNSRNDVNWYYKSIFEREGAVTKRLSAATRSDYEKRGADACLN